MTHILLIIKMAGCAYCLFFSAGMGIAYKPQVLPFASQAPQPSAETSAGVHGGGGSLNRRLIASWHRAAEPGAGGRQGGRARECGRRSMVRAPQAVRTQLGECLKALVHADFPERWPGLLPTLLRNLASQVWQQISFCQQCPAVCLAYMQSWRGRSLGLFCQHCSTVLSCMHGINFTRRKIGL